MSTEPNQQLAERPPSTVRDFLALPQYKARFGEVLGQRAPQFMASLVALSQQSNLATCEPRSIIAAAMVAATLDLPIEKSLGFAHVVGYNGVAQFQMAAKGYVQLALRSAQYHRMNAKPINAEAFSGYDEVGEPLIDWAQLDETKPTIGYVVAWKLVNGFTKVAYWPKAKVEAHAAQFSQAYKKKKMDSPWFTNFDKMALKTVVMNELRAWGILSVQMQTAMRHDMAAQSDVDADVQYIDNDAGGETTGTAQPVVDRPAPPPRAKKGAATVAENPKPAAPAPKGNVVEGEFTETKTEAPEPAKTIAADIKTEKAAEAADVARTATEAATKTTPATEQSTSRALLKPDEEYESLCEVKDVAPLYATLAKERKPSVQIRLDGGYVGLVIHHNGATEVGGALTPNPIWQVGATLRVKLKQFTFAKSTDIKAIVLSVEEASPAAVAEVG